MLQSRRTADPFSRVHSQAKAHQAQQLLIIHQQLVDPLETDYLLPSCYTAICLPLIHPSLGEIGRELILAVVYHLSGKLGLAVLDYHQDMLQVVMGCEEQVSSEQLGEDAAETPDIARLTPVAALQDYLRSTILTGVYYRTVLLGFMSSSSEVD